MNNPRASWHSTAGIASPFIGSRGVIVEDSAYGVGLARVLQRRGAADVTVCATVDAAKQLVLAHSPHWALIDTRLADAETGLALADWLRRLHPTVARISHAAFVPAPPAVAQDTASLGPLFHAIVCKPCAIATLIAAIDAHCQHAERAR